MGEFSKRIGEIGENIVADFLSLIGWQDPRRSFDIPSIYPEKHEKATHGIDGYFHYRSPMISRALDNVIMSVKYSKDKYPNSPVEKFKEHYRDLAMAIESFKMSELRSNTINQHSDIENIFDMGILFWLNDVDDDSVDLIQKLSKLEAPKEYNHDGILLIDNSRIEFVFNSIEFAKRKYPSKDIMYTYFNSGLNGDNTIPKNGKILPFQYLSSNIIPMRVEAEVDKNTLILCSREKFEEDELLKLMGLAKNITANYQSNTIIAFPDFNRLRHEQIVSGVKQVFEEPTFTSKMTVESFNVNFRN